MSRSAAVTYGLGALAEEEAQGNGEYSQVDRALNADGELEVLDQNGGSEQRGSCAWCSRGSTATLRLEPVLAAATRGPLAGRSSPRRAWVVLMAE